MKKSELYAYIGTAISGIIILLILFFVMLPGLKNTEDGGIMISFGDAFDGGGAVETPSQSAQQSSPPKAEVKEELLTQKDKSVAIPETKKKPDTTPSKTDDRQQKEQQASQIEDLVGRSMNSEKGAGSGQTTGSQTAGNPVGSGIQDGNSWSLSGRDLLGDMPRPNYNQNIEGQITVEIRVDASGNVTSARVISKTTISDQTLRNAAEKAAYKTKFSSGSGISTGKIIYNFRFKTQQ